MKLNLVFDERFLIGLNDDGLIAEYSIAICVSVVIDIGLRFPQASRVDRAVNSVWLIHATVKDSASYMASWS
jgi:hypothetical protein